MNVRNLCYSSFIWSHVTSARLTFAAKIPILTRHSIRDRTIAGESTSSLIYILLIHKLTFFVHGSIFLFQFVLNLKWKDVWKRSFFHKFSTFDIWEVKEKRSDLYSRDIFRRRKNIFLLNWFKECMFLGKTVSRGGWKKNANTTLCFCTQVNTL